MKVDINCDMGESFGSYQMGQDAEMMPFISSANIACGFHGGDPHVMRQTIALAGEHHVAIGSHPGFPDLLGFGRRYMTCTPDELKDFVIYQTGALREFAKLFNMELQHCKPHGALYMMAMEDEKLARAILEGLAAVSEKMVIFALNNSAVEKIGVEMGLPIARETFADREHTKDGSIVMTRTGPNIKDYQAMAQRVVRMVLEGKVRTPDNEDASVKVDTICIHGDTPGAPELAKEIAQALKAANIEIAPIGQTLIKA